MLHKTKGIVLHTFEYSESSIIAKIFTEQFGQQPYLVNSVRSAKAKNKGSLYQPMTLVDMVVYHKPEKSLQRISEINHSVLLRSIPYDVIKTSIALFLAEVVYKSVKEEESNPDLFHFLQTVIKFLDEHETSFANYPFFILLQLTKYLGAFPENNFDEKHSNFDLLEGKFVHEIRNPGQTLSQDGSALLHRVIKLKFDNFHSLVMTAPERKQLLADLIAYYHLHHTHGQKIKGHLVLGEILS